MAIPHYGQADFDAALAETGIPIRFGALEGRCYVDTRDEDLLRAETASFGGKVMTVVVRSDYFKGLGEGGLVIIGDAEYRVLWTRREDDGLQLRLVCIPA